MPFDQLIDRDFVENVSNTNESADSEKIHFSKKRSLTLINFFKNNFKVFNKTINVLIPNIYIDNHHIEITDFVRFLGILIDRCLT